MTGPIAKEIRLHRRKEGLDPAGILYQDPSSGNYGVFSGVMGEAEFALTLFRADGTLITDMSFRDDGVIRATPPFPVPTEGAC